MRNPDAGQCHFSRKRPETTHIQRSGRGIRAGAQPFLPRRNGGKLLAKQDLRCRSLGRARGSCSCAAGAESTVLALLMRDNRVRACPPFRRGGPKMSSPRHRLVSSCIFTVVLAVAIQGSSSPAQQSAEQSASAASLAPYVPTPQDVVDRMLKLGGVTKNDVVYDLGCGDGRIVVTAAKQFGARGVGVDIDPQRIKESEANAKAAGVEHLVSFKLQDAMTVDVSPATVVTLYLLSASNVKLRPILTKQLRPGARIVSHAFTMGDWPPEKTDEFTDSSGSMRSLYLWTTDGKVRP